MKTKKRKIMGWTFVIPASIMIVIFNFVPMIQSFILSLKRGSGTNMTFTGLSNYKRMFQDKIKQYFYLSDLRSSNHAGDSNVLSIAFE